MSLLGDGQTGGSTDGSTTTNGAGTQGSAGSTSGDGGAGGSSTSSSGSQGGGNSGSTSSWRDSLPDELKSHGSLQNFTDIAALAKSYVHAQQQIGKKGVIPPGEKSSDEEWASFYKSIGQPELDKFDIKAPEGKQLNEQTVKEFKEMAHKAGLLPKQAQGLMEWYIKNEENSVASQLVAKETKIKEGLASLKKEWGDGYSKQLAMAELPLKEFADEKTIKSWQEAGLTKDATFIKFLNKVSTLMGEDKLRGQGEGKFGKTPAELQSDIENIMANPAYFDRSHPSHMNLVRQMEVAQRALHGDK